MKQDMYGLLLVDKPKGWTSFDVVAKVRGIIRRETGEKIKVGHTGTLDPMATGLLVLAIGKATKQIQNLTKLDKVYDVEITLGATSTTDDAEGVITLVESKKLKVESVEEALESFVGEIEQIPPAYSAIKVAGQRAYKLAREGKPVKLEPRMVHIKSITKINYQHLRRRMTSDPDSTDRYGIRVPEGEFILVGLGFATSMPEDLLYWVAPRSGLSSRGISLTNAPGTVDADYRGEAGALLTNIGTRNQFIAQGYSESDKLDRYFEEDGTFVVTKNLRICQIIYQETAHPDIQVVESHEELERSERSAGGFGSTGLN